LKELTPEFYEDNPEFLLNLLDVDFGITNKNEKIGVICILLSTLNYLLGPMMQSTFFVK
jgi:hypothetical protein